MHDQQEFRDFFNVLQNLTIQTYPNNQLKHVLELKSNQHPLDYKWANALVPPTPILRPWLSDVILDVSMFVICPKVIF